MSGMSDSENVTFCPNCGASFGPEANFCDRCGAPRAPAFGQAPATEAPAAAPAQSIDASVRDALTWEYGIPLLTNRYMLWDMLRLFVFSLLGAGAIVLVIGFLVEGEIIILPFQIVAALFGILIALYVVTALLVYQNRFPAHFTVDDKRAVFRSGSRQRKLNTLGAIVGLLAGRPTVAGAALVAKSREVEVVSWTDVHEVKVDSRARVISLNNASRTILRLHCPHEIFDQVVARVQAYAAEGARVRAGRASASAQKLQPLPRLFWPAWVALAVAAAAATQAWGWLDEGAYRLSLVAGLVVALSRPLPGPFGWFAALGGVGLSLLWLVFLLLEAGRQTTFSWGATVYGYEFDTGLLLLAAIGGLALLAMSGFRLLKYDNWRVERSKRANQGKRS